MVWQSLEKKTKRSIVINALNTMGMNIEATTSWFELKQVCEKNDLNANTILQESYSKPIGFTAPAVQPDKTVTKTKTKTKTETKTKSPRGGAMPSADAVGSEYLV
tara:strand:- start:2725 stop:3039 length:315 start_codon:yes stop_codon:yes gene_type:complete